VTNLETWLEEMDSRPLPGGVAASAVAAAMGAALIAKALRISIQREPFSEPERASLSALLELAQARRVELMRLAQDDVEAYRAVIASRSLPAGDPGRGRAWQTATEVPVAVAEGCHELLDRLAGVLDRCWPGVCIDYQIGSELLRAGARAGRMAAEANLDDWGRAEQAGPLQARVDALLQAESRFEDS